MLRRFVLLLIAGCYSPTPPTGIPCVADRDCPSPQICQPITNTCETSCRGCDGGIVDAIPSVDCWNLWLAGTIDFEPPVRIDTLHVDTAGTSNSSFSPDGLTIYVERSNDPMRATRSSLDAAFGAPQLVTELASAAPDSRISTTADNLLAVFASERTGTLGDLDLWQATRTSPNDPFGGVTAAPFAGINDALAQFDPEISPDGLHLYWAPSVLGGQLIRHASRATTQDAFTNVSTLAIPLGTLTDLYDPSVSPDNRVLVFGGQTGPGTGNLFYSTRSDIDGAFSQATEVPGVNSDSLDGDPDVSADGCSLVFASNRNGTFDIYSATVRRP